MFRTQAMEGKRFLRLSTQIVDNPVHVASTRMRKAVFSGTATAVAKKTPN
jgi:hypothetical protein